MLFICPYNVEKIMYLVIREEYRTAEEGMCFIKQVGNVAEGSNVAYSLAFMLIWTGCWILVHTSMVYKCVRCFAFFFCSLECQRSYCELVLTVY